MVRPAERRERRRLHRPERPLARSLHQARRNLKTISLEPDFEDAQRGGPRRLSVAKSVKARAHNDILPDTVCERLSETVFAVAAARHGISPPPSLKAAGISSKPWMYAL